MTQVPAEILIKVENDTRRPVSIHLPRIGSTSAAIYTGTLDQVGRLLRAAAGMEQDGNRDEAIPLLDFMPWADMAVGQQGSKVEMFFRRRGPIERVLQISREEMSVTIPFNMIWHLKWLEHNLATTQVFIEQRGQEQRLLGDIDVSYWPWGNVYERGDICWGETSTRGLRPADPLAVEALFLGSPFNNDLRHSQVPNLVEWYHNNEDHNLPTPRGGLRWTKISTIRGR